MGPDTKEPAQAAPTKPFDLSPGRVPGGSFEEYKARRRLGNKVLHIYGQGRRVWDSKRYGTVSRANLPKQIAE